MREAARKAGLELRVDSVGTAAYHIGEHPDPRAIATAATHGVDISGALGRQLSDSDFDDFTHIFAMDKGNLAGIKARKPRHTSAKVSLLLDVLKPGQGTAVADPYYGDEAGFEECWQTISTAVDVLVKELADQASPADA